MSLQSTGLDQNVKDTNNRISFEVINVRLVVCFSVWCGLSKQLSTLDSLGCSAKNTDRVSESRVHKIFGWWYLLHSDYHSLSGVGSMETYEVILW